MRASLNVLAAMLACLPLIAVRAQPLKSAASDPNDPPHLAVSPGDAAQLRASLNDLLDRLQALRESDLAPAEKQAALAELIREHKEILERHEQWVDWQEPQTVDSVAVFLEKLIFDIAAEDIAPTEAAREQVLRDAPAHLGLDPGPADEQEHYEPPLLAPVEAADNRLAPDLAEPQAVESPSAELAPGGADPAPAVETVSQQGPRESNTVAVLADDTATTNLHDDNTVVREVTDDQGELLLFGDVRLWAGGAMQLDVYSGDGLFTLAEGGNSESETYVRRAEGILRAALWRHQELKAQYDFDAKLFRDFYWRWLSESTASAVTIGNQKEPMGLDYLVGSKFTTAMEPSAPSTAFGNYRSAGIRYSTWGAVDDMIEPLQWWGDNRTYLTGAIGAFGEDIENSNDTDWAVTGRGTIGARTTETTGYHLGVSMSYRHGEYTRIAPRPGLHDANRIPLAQPDADTQAVFALEGMVSLGSLHGQAEMYYSDYSGAEVDAEGWGGYAQLGWLFGGKRRIYQPRWGMWRPVDATRGHVFEVFGRVSLTHGNDDLNSSNDLTLLTLGGNWYYRSFRGNANLIYAESGRDLVDQDDGFALGLRFQYLF